MDPSTLTLPQLVSPFVREVIDGTHASRNTERSRGVRASLAFPDSLLLHGQQSNNQSCEDDDITLLAVACHAAFLRIIMLYGKNTLAMSGIDSLLSVAVSAKEKCTRARLQSYCITKGKNMHEIATYLSVSFLSAPDKMNSMSFIHPRAIANIGKED